MCDFDLSSSTGSCILVHLVAPGWPGEVRTGTTGIEFVWISLDIMSWLACVKMTTWPGGRVCPLMEIGEPPLPIVLMKEGTMLLGIIGCGMKKRSYR